MWRRARSQAAVEPAWTPWSAPAAPRASTPASSASQWPSRRSMSPRNTMTRSAPAPSGSWSGSWSVSSWSSATSADNPVGVPVGWLVECVFESMAGTYQPSTRTQAPTRKCGKPSRHRLHQRQLKGSIASPELGAALFSAPVRSRATLMPGGCMGPERGEHHARRLDGALQAGLPRQASAWTEEPEHQARQLHRSRRASRPGRPRTPRLRAGTPGAGPPVGERSRPGCGRARGCPQGGREQRREERRATRRPRSPPRRGWRGWWRGRRWPGRS